jgi:hypothetical protein
MKKVISNNDVYYSLAWSPIFLYDRFDVIRKLPELSGILCIYELADKGLEHLIFYSCWRDGCRLGMKKLMDPMRSIVPELPNNVDAGRIFYKYTVVESTISDFLDILYWLIRAYNPRYNDNANFRDSGRYGNIFIEEIKRNRDQVLEKFPRGKHSI